MDRRAFILAGAASAAAPAGQAGAAASRRAVTVGGRRARVVDIHAHCALREVETVLAGTPLARRMQDLLIWGDDDIAEMDRRGVDVAVLSVNAQWAYEADEALSERIVRTHDEGLARLVAAYPDRLAALSSVSLQFPELAARQLEHAVRNLGARGAAIGGHARGEAPSSAKYDPFWAKCQELAVPVFMHPTMATNVVREGVLAGRGDLSNVIGNPLETTVFLSRLIFDGVLDRFPGLKVCAAHGGGYLASYLGRTVAACTFRPEADCANRKSPGAYFKDQILVDSMVFSQNAIHHLVAEMGAGQVVYGTDIPYSWPDSVDLILGSRTLSDDQKLAILGGNLVRLLRLPA